VLVILFSSNIRPQYETDILNVAALASNQRYRFRYEIGYVDPDLQPGLSTDGLAGEEALVVYSIQQTAGYHPPAFIPVRWATIARSWQHGAVFVVEFAAGRFPSIGEGRDREECRSSVLDLNRQLIAAVNGHPGADSRDHRFSAALAKKLAFAKVEDGAIGFQQLTRHLANTISFAQQPFWTVSRLGRPGSLQSVPVDRYGSFHLETGRVFEITISHYQPRDLARIHRFIVSSDSKAVTLVGPGEFDIASRYDEIPMRFSTDARLDGITESVLSIRPADDQTVGPKVDLPLLIGRPDVVAAPSAAA